MVSEPISEEAYPIRALSPRTHLPLRHLGYIKDPPAWCPRERACSAHLAKGPASKNTFSSDLRSVGPNNLLWDRPALG